MRAQGLAFGRSRRIGSISGAGRGPFALRCDQQAFIPQLRDTRRVFGAPATTTRALYMFHGASELRRVRNPPHRGARVRRAEGEDWIVDEVLQSGANTYTVICVAPREIAGTHQRVLAYLRRDSEFVLVTLLSSAAAIVALSAVMAIWASVVLVAAMAAFVSFAWATK
jgi:hypothetical protein